MDKLVRDAGLADRVTLDSAGTGDWHVGELPDPRTRAAAAKRGYRLEHRARQFTAADFARFDLVVCMDRENLAHVQRLALMHETEPPPRIELLRSFEAERAASDVPDPYAGGADGFEDVLDICERACRGLLEHVAAGLR